MKSLHIKNNQGYTLLFAVLVGSLLLSIGVSILSISRKEVILSSSGRESQYAFYAADTGLECTLFHFGKTNPNPFASTTYNGSTEGEFTINCNDEAINVTYEAADVDRGYLYTFYMPVTEEKNVNDACVRVDVTEQYELLNGKLTHRTRIAARGYNSGYNPDASSGPDCSEPFPLKVERGLEVKL